MATDILEVYNLYVIRIYSCMPSYTNSVVALGGRDL